MLILLYIIMKKDLGKFPASIFLCSFICTYVKTRKWFCLLFHCVIFQSLCMRWTPLNSISSVQSLGHVWLFATPWIAAWQASPYITNSLSLLKLMSIESVMSSNHLILCRPLLLPPIIFPASPSLPMSQFLASGGQSIGVSTTVLQMNIQNWFPLGWTGWISLLFKGLSRVFSKITVQKHRFFGAQLSL